MLSAAEAQILATSFGWRLLASLWSLPFAIACAFLLSRPFPGKFLLDGLVHLPIILPPVLIGFLLLMLFGRRGPVGALAGTGGRHPSRLHPRKARRWPPR